MGDLEELIFATKFQLPREEFVIGGSAGRVKTEGEIADNKGMQMSTGNINQPRKTRRLHEWGNVRVQDRNIRFMQNLSLR